MLDGLVPLALLRFEFEGSNYLQKDQVNPIKKHTRGKQGSGLA